MLDRQDLIRSVEKAALQLAWSLWGELGVSTWEPRRHQAWSIELEPLIAFTAMQSKSDPRLLAEAVDWCVTNQRFVSSKQFRQVITHNRWQIAGEIADFGATVAARTNAKWPGLGVPQSIRIAGKSSAPDLRRPALYQLRLRGIFGVGAKAEIIRVMLAQPTAWSVRQVTDQVAYNSRQVSLDLEMLASAGLLKRSTGSPARYVVARPDQLASLLGPLPTYAPKWGPILRVVYGIVDALYAVMEVAAPAPELARRMRLLSKEVEESELAPWMPDRERDFLEHFSAWALELCTALAEGNPVCLPQTSSIRSEI